jgi:hypothetical protein
MRRFLCYLVLCALLAACSGVPLRSLPRLMRLSGELLDANPAEFMVALQVDARMVPPPGAVPQLVIKLTPREAGAFEPVDKKLPLQQTVASTATLGLDAPPPGRRWLVHSLPADSQAELRRIQYTIRLQMAKSSGNGGGSLSVGVEQDALAAGDPALAHTRWETWLQTSRRDGFYEVWSGTPAQLQEAASQSRGGAKK